MVEIKKTTKTNFLNVMGANPTNRIIDFLIENKRDSWSMIEIRDGANVSYATLKTILPKMQKIGLLKITRQIGKSKLYTIDEDNPIVKKIMLLHKEIIQESEMFINV